KLEAWLRTKLPAAEALSIGPLDKATSGYASEIHFFDLNWREGDQEKTERLVIREAPTDLQIHPDYDVGIQFNIMRCLEGSSVPMPRTYWLEEDDKVLGAPFFIMERVEGEILNPIQPGEEPRGPLFAASPEQRCRMWRQAIEVIANINTVDWERQGLYFLGVPKDDTDAIARQISHYERMWKWGGVQPQSIFDDAFAWFRRNLFEPEHISLCWGDARLGNLMYREDRVVAVLDWDMAHIGAPEADLAWLLAIEWMTKEAIGTWDGVPDRGEVIQCYESMIGRRLQNFHYHEAFAMLKLSILFLRVISTIPGIPSDFVASGDLPPVKRLAQMLTWEEENDNQV
ncbi:MAG: phosphotransferase family protein, partial [Dehalococcoidia bacterium]